MKKIKNIFLTILLFWLIVTVAIWDEITTGEIYPNTEKLLKWIGWK